MDNVTNTGRKCEKLKEQSQGVVFEYLDWTEGPASQLGFEELLYLLRLLQANS